MDRTYLSERKYSGNGNRTDIIFDNLDAVIIVIFIFILNITGNVDTAQYKLKNQNILHFND